MLNQVIKEKIEAFKKKRRENWNAKKDSVKYLKDHRDIAAFFVMLFTSFIIISYNDQEFLFRNIIAVILFGVIGLYLHYKIQKKLKTTLFLEDKVISCPYCKHNFDLQISRQKTVEDMILEEEILEDARKLREKI